MLDPRCLKPEVFLIQAAALGVSPYNAQKLLSAVIGKGELHPDQWSKAGLITKTLASQLSPLSELELRDRIRSKSDNFEKLIFKTHDGLSIETVIIPLHKNGCVSICLSSQVGCVMGCTFCATARMPQRRNLKSWEILDQMRQARKVVRASGRRVTGAVFMGMGEPFLNYDNVILSARLLSYPLFDAIRSKAITISTVGLIPEIKRYTEEGHPFRLSISLGAATDEKRRKLVPIAARHSLKDLIQAAEAYAVSRNDRVNLSYVCIGGENVSLEDARALSRLVKNFKVRIDLIELTDALGVYRPPTNEEMKLFRDALSESLSQPVVRRYSGGKDILAACGTLSAGTVVDGTVLDGKVLDGTAPVRSLAQTL